MTKNRDNPIEGRRFFSGRLLILVTLSLVVIVPTVTFFTWRWVHGDVTGHRQPLNWVERAHWQPLPVTEQSFRRGVLSSARTGETYRDLGFQPRDETITGIQAAAEVARKRAADFAKPAVREALEQVTQRHEDLAYPTYLLGTWHRVNGHETKAARQYAEAFELAEAALVQPYKTPSGEPAANRSVPPIVIALDRVEEDVLVQNLHLVFPRPRTDERGRVYLPVPKTAYRLTSLEALTAEGRRPEQSGWVTFPGRSGRLTPRTVESP